MVAAHDPESDPLLRVRDLSVVIRQPTSSFLALQKISFELRSGQTLALIGESGSGKTMTALALLGLLPGTARQTHGRIDFAGREIYCDSGKSFDGIRGRQISMIFQEPKGAINPVFPVGKQIGDVIRRHLKISRQQARTKTQALLQQVGLADPERVYRAYLHQLSGGMAQRVMIAMALSCEPSLVIADEPTTALDVTTEAQILGLISRLQREQGFALMLISHDIKVVSHLADDIVVLQSGKIVEAGSARKVVGAPDAAYTQELITASSLPVDALEVM